MYQFFSFFNFSSSSYIYFSIYSESTTIVIPFKQYFSIFQNCGAKLLIIFHFVHRLIFSNEDKTVFFACAPEC